MAANVVNNANSNNNNNNNNNNDNNDNIANFNIANNNNAGNNFNDIQICPFPCLPGRRRRSTGRKRPVVGSLTALALGQRTVRPEEEDRALVTLLLLHLASGLDSGEDLETLLEHFGSSLAGLRVAATGQKSLKYMLNKTRKIGEKLPGLLNNTIHSVRYKC